MTAPIGSDEGGDALTRRVWDGFATGEANTRALIRAAIEEARLEERAAVERIFKDAADADMNEALWQRRNWRSQARGELLAAILARKGAAVPENRPRGLRINRAWAMPNKWTFTIPPIRKLVERLVGDGAGWADPFAGQSTLAQFRNDLDPVHNQPSQVESLEFLRLLPSGLNGVLFDPPYSLTEVSRSYRGMGLHFKGSENPAGGFPKARDEVARIVRPAGLALSFGWNTVGMGKGRGFELLEILIVSHGGNRNDTLCTVEVRRA